jgi:hypothetical protein
VSTQEPLEPRVEPLGDYFRLVQAVLLQPDAELAARLVKGAEELSAYLNTLVWVGSQYFGQLGRDFGSLGVLIAIGIRPPNRTKLWCEPVSGDLPKDVWNVFVDLLEGAGENIRPTVIEPVACVLECALGAGPSEEFPVPSAWRAASRDHGPLSVPDELFAVVFPE